MAFGPPVRYLGIENGLSNNAVTDVYQDYKGFMWFTTYDGLNKYDGRTFTVYRNKIGDSTSLKGNEVYTIADDLSHNLWVGGRSGLSVYHPDRNAFTIPRYRSLEGNMIRPISSEVLNIVADGHGNMLVSTESSGLLVFEKESMIGQQARLMDGNKSFTDYKVSAIGLDSSDGATWLIVENFGLCRYSGSDHRVRVINNSFRQGNCLKPDGRGSLWFGNDNGLYKYNIGSNLYSGNFVEGSFKISGLCIDRTGVLWIASDGKGVLVMSSTDAKARPYTTPDGKPVVNSSAVYSIYEDKQGRKWIATLRGGVNIIEARPNPIRTIVYNSEKAPNPNNNFILSFCEDQDQNIWIGTDGGGLRYWNRAKDTYAVYTHDPVDMKTVGGNFITGIIRDQQNEIWVSSYYGGISRFKKAAKHFEHYTCYNPYTHSEENKVWFLYEDRQRQLWASTTNDGTLYILNRELNRFEPFDTTIINVQCLAEDKAGNFWGGNYSSLIRIDRERKKHQKYELGYTVRCIHEDSKGNFWIGTQGGGLLLFDRANGTYKRFDDLNGLRSNTILRILEDPGGNLWMSTFNGLIRFDARERSFRSFSQSDGLQSDQFSFNAAISLKSGEFLFGGIKGFNIFYPDSVYGQAPPPVIYLTAIRVEDKPLEATSPFVFRRALEDIQAIEVPYEKATLSFDFVAPEYSAPDKVQYAYFLQGWDKRWNFSNMIRTANYSHLQEGMYTFYLKATDALGRWGEEKMVLSVRVLPPWYRTWWAYLAYGCCLAGAIFLYIRYTKKQERLRYEIKLAHLEHEKDKELNEKKLSFFTNISHEFRTPLTLIINPLKEVVHDKKSGGADWDLTTAYRNARRLLSLVDQLLLFRKADSGADILKISRLNLIELCHEVFLCFIQQAKTKNIDYQFLGGLKDPEIWADREKIEIALFNLLSNAFKFTPDGGTIHLILGEIEGEMNKTAGEVSKMGGGVNKMEGGVRIIVEDNGCGIAPGDIQGIFGKFRQAQAGGAGNTAQRGFGIGLYLVRHFVESHQGRVYCQSAPGKGARFTIELLKGTAHLPAAAVPAQAKLGENALAGLDGKDQALDQPGNGQSGNGSHENRLLEELADGADLAPVEKEDPLPAGEGGKRADEIVTGKRSLLLIDDDEEIRQYLEHIFMDKYLLYQAGNGNDGFRLAQDHMPDLIISDINMQGMDGVELCNRIKKSEALGHIPVILLTGTTAPDAKLKGIEGGADDYITKPFDKDLLQAKVGSILRNRDLLRRYFFDSITLKETAIKVPAEYQEFLRRCIEAIEANIDTEDFTTIKFAKAMGMSRSSVYQKVKSISGQSLNAFIRSIRLRRAAVLMLKENMNVNQAAFQVGIGDVRYFREQFVKVFGMTPSEYIKKYRPSFNGDFNIIKGMEES